MSVPTKIAVGVAGGYLLGRTKKLRLAMALAGMLAGKRLAAQREDLLSQGTKLIQDNPQLKELQSQITRRLVEVAREAALTAAATRVEALTKSLQSHQQDGGEESGEQQEGGGAVGAAGDAATGAAGTATGAVSGLTRSLSGLRKGKKSKGEQDQPD